MTPRRHSCALRDCVSGVSWSEFVFVERVIDTYRRSRTRSRPRSNRGAPTHGRCARAPHVRRARDRPVQSAKPRRCGVGAPAGCDGPDGGAGRDARDGCDGRDAGCDCDAPPAPSFAEYSCTYFLILASPGTGSMPWRSSVRTTTRVQLRPVEIALDPADARAVEVERLEEVVLHRRRQRRREQHPRHARVPRAEVAEGEVVGAEVAPPRDHAVHL